MFGLVGRGVEGADGCAAPRAPLATTPSDSLGAQGGASRGARHQAGVKW